MKKFSHPWSIEVLQPKGWKVIVLAESKEVALRHLPRIQAEHPGCEARIRFSNGPRYDDLVAAESSEWVAARNGLAYGSYWGIS